MLRNDATSFVGVGGVLGLDAVSTLISGIFSVMLWQLRSKWEFE